ncbi:haloalkane dehalogenase [Actinospongicola halichondriae]|uniref:haloalkane dehalogenase n=1 Tax=Actinospongicola halichondriae TaxID=3236844 RepID=UPI003D459A69
MTTAQPDERFTTPDGIEFVRTPDERFQGCDDFPYEPQYVDVDGLRMAYVDVGERDAPTLLLLHGEPTCSYLYRRMIPLLVDAGYRCVAPDLIGFGRSDKPTSQDAYSYARHVGWVESFVQAVGLDDTVLFAQDWGGLIGLRVVAGSPDRFRAVCVGNTGLPVGEPIGDGFSMWLGMSQDFDFTQTGQLMAQAAQARELTESELAAYDAPFPTPAHTAGAIVFPRLVPITPEHGGVAENKAAWDVLRAWTKPFLTLWCPDDFVLGQLQPTFTEAIPGADGQPHQTFQPGGHFLQDDRGEDVAAALIDWLAAI